MSDVSCMVCRHSDDLDQDAHAGLIPPNSEITLHRQMKSSSQQCQAFGNALTRARENNKMTQREVAQALNVSRHLISAWERGTSEPSPQDACRVEEELGVEPGELTRHLGYLPLAAADWVMDSDVETAVLRDPRLPERRKRFLLGIYRQLIS